MQHTAVYPPAIHAISDDGSVVVALLPALAERGWPESARPSATGTPIATAPVRPAHSSCVAPEQALLQLAGYEPVGPGELPGALCRFRADTGRSAPPALVCADPVHLLADRDTARLADGAALALTHSDAQRLCDAVNELLKADKLHLYCPTPDRWYLEGLDALALDTAPTSYVRGRSLDAFVPAHENAASWRTLMTEMQMLLHAHPVNGERQQRGLPAINGVWFWGGAALPPRAQRPALTVFSDDPFAIGLCALSGVACHPLSGFGTGDTPLSMARSGLSGPSLFVLMEGTGSSDIARASLERLQSLHEAGQFSRVIIDYGDHCAFDLARLQQGFWERLKAKVWRS